MLGDPVQRPINTAVDLWSAFNERAGLQTAQRNGGRPNYDTQLLGTLRQELYLPQGPIQRGLKSTGCSLEALFCAIMLALQPWSRMMRDVLAMLNEAKAVGSGETLELHVQLKETTPELRETLEGFRRQALESEAIVTAASARRWGELDLWSLRDPLGDTYWKQAVSPRIEAWLDDYRDGDRTAPPPLELTGHAEYDKAVAELQEALRSCLRASRAAGDTAEARSISFRAEQDRDFGDGWRGHAMVSLDSDRAVGAVLQSYDVLPRRLDWGPETAAAAALYIRNRLEKVPAALPVRKRVRQLLDLLDFPIWRRRHELYSVWIATLVRRAAAAVSAPIDWTWRTEGGVLSFAFAGAVVAELKGDGQGAYFWAELRRKAQGQSRKGRRHIQPDYTLLLGPDRHLSPAGLVVECKQYRRPSGSNFTAALEDYASTHEFAPVALVNYGPAGSAAVALSDAISCVRPSPVAAFGLVQPGGAGEMKALTWLSDNLGMIGSLGRAIACVFPPSPTKIAAEIVLSWIEGGDLDLHLTADNGEQVDYRSLGSLAGPPWMQLDGDIREPGTERATIAESLRGRCSVHVELFAGEQPAAGAATIRVSCGQNHTTFTSPAGVWPRWAVCTIDLESGTIDAVDETLLF
ncbi:hypothetical protein [Ensifer sp. BR816]|uniref:hypothetical protein n=1 Tax=Rhizobium sp. (strain BR816) TaxID=1057002 RepID=UPI0003758363|nr:hypothetical protein [Ensifer sp. BR816]